MIIKSEKGERVSAGVDVFVCVLAPDCVCVCECVCVCVCGWVKVRERVRERIQ